MVAGYVTDDLDRANGGIGANYTPPAGSSAPLIVSSHLEATADNTSYAAIRTAETYDPNQFVELTAALGSSYSEVLLILRFDDVNNFVALNWNTNSGGTYDLYERIGGSSTSIGTATSVGTSSRRLRMELWDGLVAVYIDNVPIASPISTSKAASGAPGISLVRNGGTTPTIDDIEFGDLFAPRAEVDENTTGGTISLSEPAGTEADDLLLAFLLNYNSGGSPGTPAEISGFTTDATELGVGNNRVRICHRVIDETESPPYTSAVGTSNYSLGYLARVLGADPDAPIHDYGYNEGNSTTPTFPSLTPTVSCLALAMVWTDNALSGTPSGWHIYDDAWADQTIVFYYRYVEAGEATGTPTVTAAGSAPWGVSVVLLEPAAGGAPSPTFPVVEATAETAISTASTSHTVTLPGGIQESDLVLLIGDIGSTAATVNALTDWSESLDENNANGLKIIRYTGTGVPSNPTFTLSASTRGAWLAFRISNADKTIAPQIGTTATGTSTTPNPPSVTPTGSVSKDFLSIAFFGAAGEEADDDTWCDSPPTNWGPTPPLQKTCGTAGTNLGGLIAAAYRQITTGSALDPGTFTKDVSSAWRAQHILIHPIIDTGENKSTTGSITLSLADSGDVVKAAGASGSIQLQTVVGDDVSKATAVEGLAELVLALDGEPSKVGATAAELLLGLELSSEVQKSGQVGGQLSFETGLSGTSEKTGVTQGEVTLVFDLLTDLIKHGSVSGEVPLDLTTVGEAVKTVQVLGNILLDLNLVGDVDTAFAKSTAGSIALTTLIDAVAQKSVTAAAALQLTFQMLGDTEKIGQVAGSLGFELDFLSDIQKIGQAQGDIGLQLGLQGEVSALAEDQVLGSIVLALALTATAVKSVETAGNVSTTLNLSGIASKSSETYGLVDLELGIQGDVTAIENPDLETTGTISVTTSLVGHSSKTSSTVGSISLVLALSAAIIGEAIRRPDGFSIIWVPIPTGILQSSIPMGIATESSIPQGVPVWNN